MKLALPASLVLISFASCAETREAPEPPPATRWTRKDLLPKAEWIDRLILTSDAPVDLVEAASVLTNSTRAEWRPPEEIRQSLAPVLDKVRKRIGSRPSAEAKIAALNDFLIPRLTDPRRPVLPWVYEVFQQQLGGCLPSCLIYLLAADTLSLTLEPVAIPGHILLQLRTGNSVRRIETTSRGEHLSLDEYRAFLARHPEAHEPFPDDPALAEKLFLPLSRRQLAATLIAMTAQKYPARTSEEDFQAAVRIAPELPYPWAMFGSYYQRVGKIAEAEKMFTRAIALAPYHPIYRELRWKLRTEAGQIQAGLEDIDVALDLVHGWPDYHVDRALSLSLLGRRQEAFRECAAAVQGNPGHVGARRFRASFLEKDQRIHEAILEMNALVDRGTAEAPDFYNRGALRLEVHDPRAALDDFRRSAELDPRQADTWRGLGSCALQLRRYVEAVDDFTRSIELAPLDARGYWFRSHAYAGLGDDAHCESDLRRFHELDVKK